ncbi:MAG: VCBS repeat-containing protein [Candidatus Latescibacteria bacterium]|nr:VCBS repeat-containing protein [Candidatus Latescibacterota bacterium]
MIYVKLLHHLQKKIISLKYLRFFVFVIFILAAQYVYSQTWVEDTFEDFDDGLLDASGQNIYVSRDGKIRTIHRFDINDDGYIDLLFNSTHNDYAFVPSTIVSSAGNRRIQSGELAVEGSLAAEIADLNRDGFPDIIFCPAPSGVQRSRRFVTIIWGGEDGWPSHRSNGILPTHGARALAVADLNCDLWPDIVTLNHGAWLPGQPEGNILRIYWGSERGFLLQRYHDIGIQGASALTSGDFDSDGYSDTAVLASDGIYIIHADLSIESDENYMLEKIILKGSGFSCLSSYDSDSDGYTDLIIGGNNKTIHIVPGKEGRTWGNAGIIEGFSASHISAGDIDGDSYPDLALSFFSQIRAGGGEMTGGEADVGQSVNILWGDDSGFSTERFTSLNAPYNIASAIVDFDGDGLNDVICAIHQGEKLFDAESLIYYGMGNRKFQRGKTGIPTIGAYHVNVIKETTGKKVHAVFSNSKGGNLREEVPLNLYWGSPDGFDPGRRLQIPFRSGYEATAADLDADGFVDLIAIDEMHGGQKAEADPWHGVNIFKGGLSGFDFEKGRTVLHEVNAGTSNVADLNRDGFLDIVVGFFERGDGVSTELVIYYGDSEGYNIKNRTAIPCEGRSNSPMIADYDKDGWLDIAVNSFIENKVRIFYGDSDGFNENNVKSVDVPGVIDLETADLNGDGWLDIIACSYYDNVNNHNDTGVLLFWGSSQGFQHWNSQWLPGITPLGPVIADFDADGYLDLFCPHYHGELHRELLPCYLYWGGSEGFFPRRRTVLINDSAADGLAADFNRDGLLDLAVVNHTIDGNHNAALSKVYYNNGSRFTAPDRIEHLPSPGAHWMWNEDMGHIYDRSYRQTYESSVFEWDGNANRGKLTYNAEIPAETKLRFLVRAANTGDLLAKQSWRSVESETFTLNKEDRFMQYKAEFISDNGDRFPVLDRVTIQFNR